MQLKSIFSSNPAIAVKRTNVALILALSLGLFALAIPWWSPGIEWLDKPVQGVTHALSMVLIAMVITGRYRCNRQRSRDDAARDRQLQAMLSMFLVVKHELHNDMQVVMGNAEMASMMLESGGAPGKPVENINKAAALAVDRIHQLSVFSAPMRAAPAAIDINALLRETTSQLTSEFPAIVMLRLELEPLHSRILADRKLLSLSLSYLIRLAAKTLSHGGEIVVRTRRASAQMGGELITATMEIFIVRGLGRADRMASEHGVADKHHAKFERVLEEARKTTQALVERSGACVLIRPFTVDSESLIKIGFVVAHVASGLRESVVMDES